jgi:hypothetical protein
MQYRLWRGLTEPVGTGPVRPVPGGTGPTRYLNRTGSHPKPNLEIPNLGEPAGFTGKPALFVSSREPAIPRYG